MKNLIFLLLTTLPILLSAQNNVKPDVWKPFRFFEGNWEGTGQVENKPGNYMRSYQFIYNGKFIEIRNKSVFQPTANNSAGEVHEDLGYISYDKSRKAFVLRQFHIEGFVNQYVLDSISDDGKTIVFVTEAIENIPTGWRAKETYTLSGENEFTETFELAAPNQPFDVYSQVKLTRK
jgi:hypothetical protein